MWGKRDISGFKAIRLMSMIKTEIPKGAKYDQPRLKKAIYLFPCRWLNISFGQSTWKGANYAHPVMDQKSSPAILEFIYWYLIQNVIAKLQLSAFGHPFVKMMTFFWKKSLGIWKLIKRRCQWHRTLSKNNTLFLLSKCFSFAFIFISSVGDSDNGPGQQNYSYCTEWLMAI